jgi:hypothetical protein
MSRPDEFREAIARAEGIDPADIPQSVPLVNDPPEGLTGINMYNPRGDAEYFNTKLITLCIPLISMLIRVYTVVTT